MDPHVNHGNGEACMEAGREPFPADDQAAVLALKPRQRPLGLEARGVISYGTPPWLSVVPDAFGNLGAHSTSTEALAKGMGVIAFVGHQHLEPFARSAAFARVHPERI